MPTSRVRCSFAPPVPTAQALAWLDEAFASAGLSRAPFAWLGDAPNPVFLGSADPLAKAADHGRIKVAFGVQGSLSTGESYLVELAFAPTAAEGVTKVTAWPPSADYLRAEPWTPVVDCEPLLTQFAQEYTARAGSAANAEPTRQSVAQAVALAQSAVGAGDWQVQMVRMIPAGHRPAGSDTWVIRFASLADKQAMAVIHVDDANGAAVRG